MNRGLLIGVVAFLAVLGIALLGGGNQAVAGHGCHGCAGAMMCDGMVACGGAYAPCGGVAVDCGCAGPVVACAGRPRHGLFAHHRARRAACMGAYPVADCCGVAVVKGGWGYGPVQKGGPIQKEGPVQKAGPVQKEGPVQKGGAAQKDGMARIAPAARPFAFYQMSFRQ